jgi:hypothetical protein
MLPAQSSMFIMSMMLALMNSTFIASLMLGVQSRMFIVSLMSAVQSSVCTLSVMLAVLGPHVIGIRNFDCPCLSEHLFNSTEHNFNTHTHTCAHARCAIDGAVGPDCSGSACSCCNSK